MNDDNVKSVETAGSATEGRLFIGLDREEIDPNDLSNLPEATKNRLLSIFLQSLGIHRVREFFAKNLVIQDRVDPEAKTIDTLVIETPIAVGPPLSSTQLYEIKQALSLFGCKNPDKAFESIMALLGQEKPLVELA